MRNIWAALFAFLLISPALSADVEAVDPTLIRVVDGDTIRIEGQRSAIRLVGFNAPETQGAACPSERAMGLRATARLIDLIDGGPATLQIVPCACPTGSEGTDRCNYGRKCGILSVEGVDVGRTLIAEGLAVPFVCSGTRCPPTPKPWCAQWRGATMRNKIMVSK
jgi:micrococcal nuclease